MHAILFSQRLCYSCSRYKVLFGSLSSVIIALFLVRNMVFATRLAIGEFKCEKPSLDSIPENATDMIVFNHLFNTLLVIVELLHIPEYFYLFKNLYKCTLGKDNIRKKLPSCTEMKDFMKKLQTLLFVLVMLFFSW